MGNRKCRWVHARLPLSVGDRGLETSERSGKGGDLVAEDHDEIERHLAGCTCCRGHQIALQQAFGALMAASALPSVDPHVPSLWPILERRIADQDAIATSRQAPTISSLADRLARTWTIRDCKRPRLGSVLLYGAAASLLVTLITLSIARRQWLNAQSIIAGNTSPLAQITAPIYVVDEASSRTSPSNDDGDVPVNHLADADPVRLPEAPGAGLGPLKPAIHTRLGYDLEHGTQVSPDTRESKPIY
jgi:hypothetical protein